MAATSKRDQKIQALQARLVACVAVLESLKAPPRVDPACLETIERVVRHAKRVLPRA